MVVDNPIITCTFLIMNVACRDLGDRPHYLLGSLELLALASIYILIYILVFPGLCVAK